MPTYTTIFQSVFLRSSNQTIRRGCRSGIGVLAGAAVALLANGATAGATAATAELSILQIGYDHAEVGDSGQVMTHGFDRFAVGEGGDVIFRSSLVEWDPQGGFDGAGGLAFISPSTRVFWHLAAGSEEPQPYLSSLLEAPHIDGDYFLDHAIGYHGPAADGSLLLPSRLRDATGSQIESYVLYGYENGEYTVIMDSGDVPGLPGYTVTEGGGFSHALARAPDGRMTVRLEVDDPDGESTHVWFRGDEEGLEPVMTWGDPTGIMVNEESEIDNREYHFAAVGLGFHHLRPVINHNGEIFFFSQARADENEALDLEATSFQGIWRVKPEDSSPELFFRTGEPFVDMTTGNTRQLEEFTSSDTFSVNNQGEAVIRHYRDDPDVDWRKAQELWLKDSEGFHSIAMEYRVAPNLDMVGWEEPDEFRRVGNAALSDTGNFSFYGSVDGGSHWALWISDETEIMPVVIEGMDAPIDGFYFSEVTDGRDGGGSVAPVMNNQDQVLFRAELTSDDDTMTLDSFWIYDPEEGLVLIARQGAFIEVAGATKLVDWENGDPVWERIEEPVSRQIFTLERPVTTGANFMAYGPNRGIAAALNDAGEVIFAAGLGGDFSRVQIEEGETGYVRDQSILVKATLSSGEPTPKISYEDWIANLPAEEQPDEEERGPLDAPAGDGMSNLLKYAFDLPPLTPSRDSLPQLDVVEVEGVEYLFLAIEKNPAATGIEYIVEVSADLETWESGSGETVVVQETDETLVVRDQTPVTESEGRFMHLRVQQ